MAETIQKRTLSSAYGFAEMMLRSYYSTCKPVRFETRILFPGMGAFHKDNAFELPFILFGSWGLPPENAEDALRLKDLRGKDSFAWVHADCQCTAAAETRPAKFPRFRMTPDWDTHEQELIKKNLLWATRNNDWEGSYLDVFT